MMRRIEVWVDFDSNLMLADKDFDNMREDLEDACWAALEPYGVDFPDVMVQANETSVVNS